MIKQEEGKTNKQIIRQGVRKTQMDSLHLPKICEIDLELPCKTEKERTKKPLNSHSIQQFYILNLKPLIIVQQSNKQNPYNLQKNIRA